MNKQDIDYICDTFRFAADKSGIVSILSDQFNCDEDDMRDFLELKGFSVPKRERVLKRGTKRLFNIRWCVEEVNILVDCIKASEKPQKMQYLLAKHGFDRTLKQIHGKIQSLKESLPELNHLGYEAREWTDDENNYLLNNERKSYLHMSKDLMRLYGSRRTHTEIQLQLARLKKII